MGKTRDIFGFTEFTVYLRETGLEEILLPVCVSHHVTLKEVYLDARGASVHAARLEVWWRLMHLGKSISEIARLFDRDHTSIIYAMRKLKEYSSEVGQALEPAIVHDLARASVMKTKIKLSQLGHERARVNNWYRKRDS